MESYDLKHSYFSAPTQELDSLIAPSNPVLTLDVYNRQGTAIFPVTSVLVCGHKEIVLIDAQFGQSQAQDVVKKIQASGKQLTAIYISHGDPDYYFGLDTLMSTFPNVKVLASGPTIKHIRESADDKLAYWGPIMGADAPKKIIIPDLIEGTGLNLEGHRLEIFGLDDKCPDRTFVWIPSIKAVVGGVLVAHNIHPWMADTQTPESREDWSTTLNGIEHLNPHIIIPGHYLGESTQSLEAVRFTRRYIQVFEDAASKAANSQALITAMIEHYPDLGQLSSLELSAKVAKGEMQW